MRPLLPVLLRIWAAAALAGIAGGSPNACTAAEPPSATPHQPPTDYAVVANYLAVFCRYVTWPTASAETPTGSPLRIGVLGPNPFGKTLETVVDGKKLRGRPLVAIYATAPEPLANCEVVFINLDEAAARATAIATFAGKPVLTAVYLGGTPDARPTGAAIELVRVDNNVRYQLNARALAAQGLRPTPGLLENALRQIGENPR